MKRDFLELSDFSVAEHAALFRRARELKEARRRGEVASTLAGRTLLIAPVLLVVTMFAFALSLLVPSFMGHEYHDDSKVP